MPRKCYLAFSKFLAFMGQGLGFLVKTGWFGNPKFWLLSHATQGANKMAKIFLLH